MAVFSNSLDALIELVMKVPLTAAGKNWWEGTCTGGTTTTVVDTSRYEADDYFQELSPLVQVKIRTTTDEAAPQGEVRYITDWVQSTGTATVHSAFSASVGAGDTYAILYDYTWDEVKSAINMAIDAAVQKQILLFGTDETTELVADTYEYSVPSGFIRIYRVSMEDDDGNYPNPIPPDQWKIIHGDTPKLHLYRFPSAGKYNGHYYGNLWADSSIVAGRHLRIEGLKRQARLSGDTDTCEIDPNYVAYQAAAFLHASRIRQSVNDPDDHRAQFEICQGMADRFAKAARVQLPPDCKRVYE